MVLGLAGTPSSTSRQPRAPPFVVVDRAQHDPVQASVAVGLPHYAGALTNIDLLDRSATGHGLISAGRFDDVIRRLPLAARIADGFVPSLPIEMLRVALHASAVRLFVEGPVVRVDRRRRFRRAHRGRWRTPHLFLAARLPPLHIRDRRAGWQGRSAALRSQAGADRHDRSRRRRLSEHAAGRAHAGNRNPGSGAGEPVRPDLARAAAMGATPRAGTLRAVRTDADRGHAALETTQRRIARDGVHGAAGRRRVRRVLFGAAGIRRRRTRARDC